MARGDKHLEYFNITVGLIFDYLISNFPITQDIRPDVLGEPFEKLVIVASEETQRQKPNLRQQVGERYIEGSNIPPRIYVEQVLDWLEHEGFIYKAGAKDYQLTRETLTILNSVPEGLQEKFSDRLSQAVGDVANMGMRTVISETVGQIIGAAARSFTGHSG
ncbi:hypothetical protein GCM10011321_36160 [Youhaiella tibetensis]|jgi:hypothetical protein|uniref:Uncharacterized protein n=1 Tax=Paradevosia tibetensis TaxID=1447062 RepID=A0A5B9DSL5_9HYPH|nr:hypothetical protein [Youhaiella tibetensis]QEE22431.1 hypothetical protein FNA67_20690 [Youhaiella tibetensis]GGF42324.1 hypothetical protein GCM10011321_36160 [Youhaiella tibetensis]